MSFNGDPAAFHRRKPGEFDPANHVAQKTTPVDADRILIEDSEDAAKKKYVELGDIGIGGGGGGGGSYSETIGDNTETEYDIQHNLDTTDVVVQLWDLTGAVPVEATADADSIEVTDADTVTVVFAAPPAVDSYRVVILTDGGTGGGGGGSGSTAGVYGAAPAAFPPNSSNVAGNTSTAYATLVSVPRTLINVRLGIHFRSAGSNPIQWGVFAGNLASMTAVLEGADTPSTGVNLLTPSSGGPNLPAGDYIVMFRQPASSGSQAAGSTNWGEGWWFNQAGYTWTSTPDMKSGWSNYTSAVRLWLSGEDDNGDRWTP